MRFCPSNIDTELSKVRLSTHPFMSWAAVKYAAMAWSCSLSTANECPYAIHAGPYVRSSVVALLERDRDVNHNTQALKIAAMAL